MLSWICRTRGPKGLISCTWVQCATFLRNHPRWTFLFTNPPLKHKLGRGCWDLASVKFCWILFSGFRGEVENVSANQRPGKPSCFSDRHKNTNLVEDVEIMLPVKFHWIPFSRFRGEVKNDSAIRGQGGHLVFQIDPKNTKFVEDVEFLLRIKFRWILFGGFRGEVENVKS